MKKLSAVMCLLVCVSIPAYAQVNATVTGTVVDASAALIPGVTVTAQNTATGIMTTLVTNESGSYNFPSLQPGTYRLSASLPGFQTTTFNNVELGQGQQVRLNFTLQVSALTTGIEVAVTVDTLLTSTSASVGTVLSDSIVRDLPWPAGTFWIWSRQRLAWSRRPTHSVARSKTSVERRSVR